MRYTRRAWWAAVGRGAVGLSASGWLPALAQAVAPDPNRRRRCILLWMTGGPSQLDTFDLKPGHENGGPFRPIDTSAAGLQICEHLPRLARHGEHLAVVRSLSTKEGDHGRGTFLVRTGRQPGGPIRYPAIGAALSKALGDEAAALPNYVSIAPYRVFNRAAFGPGFLGPRYAPLTVAAADNFAMQPPPGDQGEYPPLRVDDLRSAENVDAAELQSRVELWRWLEGDFVARYPGAGPRLHQTVYENAIRMMTREAAEAFDLSTESAAVREAYGPGRFGQGCLMARRLVERGAAFVEVSLGTFGGGALGWDTHTNNFPAVERLCGELDRGFAALLEDLRDRGLLEETTILWIGEFGRTPKINRAAGRDHYPKAWSCVLAGGGIQGGQAYGQTSDDGSEVVADRVEIGDVLATLCAALGVDPAASNVSEIGRPIRLAEGRPIQRLLRGGA